MRLYRTFALLAGCCALAACGGKVFVDTPGASLGSGGAGSTTSQSSASGTSSTGSPVTAGSGPVTSSGPGSSVSSTASGGPPVSVSCNGAPCMPGEICCFNPSGPGDHCGTSGQCDPGYVQLSCNEPSDCPGAVCCAKLTPDMQNLTGISCQPTCEGPDELVVCSNTQPDVCPAGTACHHDGMLGAGDGYRFCVGNGG